MARGIILFGLIWSIPLFAQEDSCLTEEPSHVFKEILVETIPHSSLHSETLNAPSCDLGEEECLATDPVDPNAPKYVDILALNRMLNRWIGSEISEERLEEIKQEVVRFYVDRGYPFVLVEYPEQDLSDGVLILHLKEGVLGKIEITGNRWSKEHALTDYIHLKKEKPIDQNQLFKDLYVINQNPLRNVELIYQPGNDPLTTDVVLNVQEKRPARVYVGSDNTGIVQTERQRWFAGISVSRLPSDQTLSYQYTTATNFNRFQAHTGQYIAPLSWGHILNLYGGYAMVKAHAVGSPMLNEGQSIQASARYSIPILFRSHWNLIFGLGFDFKRTNNTVQFSDVSIFGQNVNLTQGVGFFELGIQQGSASVKVEGELFCSPGQWLKDQSSQDYNSLRPGATNHWIYGWLSFAYDQQLPHQFVLSLALRGQLTNHPLLPSEQFALGGYDTVRGYDQNSYNGDQAILVNLSLYTPAFRLIGLFRPKVHDSLRFLAFFDCGFAEDIQAIPGVPKSSLLMGVGPGIRYSWLPNFQARFDWGIRLEGAAKGDWKDRIDFSVVMGY